MTSTIDILEIVEIKKSTILKIKNADFNTRIAELISLNYLFHQK